MHLPSYQVVVIGSGASGARAALLAARRGARVLLVERDLWGGAAFHTGVLPMTSLIDCVQVLRRVRKADSFGIRADNVQAELSEWINRQRHLVARLTQNLKEELRAAGVETVQGRATLLGEGQVMITEDDAARHRTHVRASRIILATGARPRAFDHRPPGDPGPLGSARHFISLGQVPNSLIIVGGGHVGCEFAAVYRALGCLVTLIEKEDRLLPDMDAHASEQLREAFVARGIRLRLGHEAHVSHSDPTAEGGCAVRLSPGNEVLRAEQALLATGRRPNVEGLGLEAAGVEFTPERGIKVDQFLQTSAEGIYAVGDVNGLASLADSAVVQAKFAAENALGARLVFDPLLVPRCVHTDPMVAEVGINERLARELRVGVRTGGARFGAVNPTLTRAEGGGGWVKLVAESGTRRLLGAMMVGERAAEGIGELSLAISLGASVDALAAAPRAHAGFSDALESCVVEMFGRPPVPFI